VIVSNGRDVTTTDAEGRYSLPVFDNMTVMVHEPAAWDVPVDEHGVPQFFYTHKPDGTPEPLRYGGLEPTGPLPEEINFPMIRTGVSEEFSCVMMGDTQPYSNTEVGYVRDSIVDALLEQDLSQAECIVMLGDVMGDDLSLLPRFMDIFSVLGLPQYYVHGNHDFDFDATSDAHSADSWRRIVGPNYYAFERGDVLFVVLDNVVYPCGEHEADAIHDFCGDDDRPTYNGRIDATQMQWLEGLLARTPRDRRIVVATHIPLVSFADPESRKHQTDNAGRLHELLAGRPALSLSGHTHTIENHAPGQHFDGWDDATGVASLPFRHIVAGAGSGAWYQGDFNVHGNPMALQRMGAPPGVLLLDFEGADYVERYVGARVGPERRMWIGLNTPAFREWFDALVEWEDLDADERHPVPPYSVNDLADTGIVTPDDLAAGVWLTANVWDGSAETRVKAVLPDGREWMLERTQSGAGEAPRIGAEWADPFAAERQLSVSRHALLSRMGEARAQGFELFKGSDYGPAAPQPQGSIADRNMHLWRARLPEDLPAGVHAIRVSALDRHGRTSTETLIVEVRDRRPPPYFRRDVWYGDD
jgi:hypothetical protein